MTLATALDQAQRNDWDTLRGAVRAGLHDLPAAFCKSYDALQALQTEQPPAETRAAVGAGTMAEITADAALADWRKQRDQQADQLFRQALAGIQPYGLVIEKHLGQALAERLAAFAEDVATIGAHAGKLVPDDAVVDAAGSSRKFADAWLRFTATGSWYLRLRQSWAVLRRLDQVTAGVPDPLGVNSILAEVRNAPEIRPDDWRNLRAGGQGGGSAGFTGPQPWPASVHVRLAAILRDGGQVWMPSEVQQCAAYQPHVPEAVQKRLGMDPRLSIYQLAGVRGQVA